MRLITILMLCSTMFWTPGTLIAMQADQAPTSPSATENPAELPELDAFQNRGLTLSQAVAQVKRQYNGQIVSAVTKVSGNREIHVIKVLTQDGKVKTVRVPGRRRD